MSKADAIVFLFVVIIISILVREARAERPADIIARDHFYIVLMHWLLIALMAGSFITYCILRITTTSLI